MHPDRLLTESLRTEPWGSAIRRVLAAALTAVEPAAAVQRVLRRDGDTLLAGDQAYDLNRFRRVVVVGAGKAGAAMARATAEVLGPHLHTGLVVVKDEPSPSRAVRSTIAKDNLQSSIFNLQSSIFNLELVPAAHPVPDERGVTAARRIAALLDGLGSDDLVLVLLSGGGSALLTLPADWLTLADLQATTRVLLACGAPIEAINALRKHLDVLKGGGLARLAAPATVVTLILSDVVGSPLDVIASGPTVPDRSSFADALELVGRFGVATQLPAAVMRHLQRGVAGDVPDTPKPGAPLFERVQNLLVGDNRVAAEAALAAARAEGMAALLLSTFVQGEAREVGRVLAALARELVASGQPLPRPACLILGGETTVTLRGNGKGGRNQELALAAAIDLAGLERVAVVALATDGGDGPTDAAGAVATGETLARADQLGLAPFDALARNDAYSFFEPLNDLLRPGASGTNVNDLAFVFAL